MPSDDRAEENSPAKSVDVIVKVNGDSLHVALTEQQWNIMRDLLKEATTESDPEPGDKMPGGTIYAGISPDTHRPLYTTPEDAPLTYTFNEARKYAAKLDAYGYHDWRVPTKGELNVLFQNKAAIRGFGVSLSGPAGWYWSSTEGNLYDAWVQRFSTGDQNTFITNFYSSLRLVR
jgi:hypothetical protein